MPPAAAIAGDFADLRTVKSRKIVQLIIEVDVEQAKAVIDTLGFPASDKPIPVAITRLKESPSASDTNRKESSLGPEAGGGLSPKERYAKASEGEKAVTRAALLCKDATFWKFLDDKGYSVASEEDCRDALCDQLGIGQRRLISESSKAFQSFVALETEYLMATGKMASPS